MHFINYIFYIMSNTFNVNIDAEAVISQNEKENFSSTPKNHVAYDPKNYLNVRLDKNEATKKLKVRLLPFTSEGGTPFKKVSIHQVKVEKENGTGWRTFVCPTHNHMGDKCPFCELSEQAKKLRDATKNDMEKKKYGDIEFMNRAKDAWIVRCIERGHEEEGVKFWLFNSSRKKDGVYDKIINLFKERMQEAREEGSDYNIFDLNNGKDLIINLTKDSNNKTVIQIADASKPSPLSTDYEQAKSWVEDDKKWTDVYTVKPYDYMAIIVQGGIPVYDAEQGKYVDKKALNKENAEVIDKEFKETYTEQKKDFTKFEDTQENATVSEKANNTSTTVQEEEGQKVTNSSNVFMDEDDLPF